MMTLKDEVARLKDTVYGNGKRGIMERIGRLELAIITVGVLILGMQTPILIMLIKMALK